MLFRWTSPSGDDSIRRERDVDPAAHAYRSRGICRLAFKSRNYLDRLVGNYDFYIDPVGVLFLSMSLLTIVIGSQIMDAVK